MSKKTLKFHIKSDDYFGTLATILSLIEQTASTKAFTKQHLRILRRLVKDLMILQKEYSIVKKV